MRVRRSILSVIVLGVAGVVVVRALLPATSPSIARSSPSLPPPAPTAVVAGSPEPAFAEEGGSTTFETRRQNAAAACDLSLEGSCGERFCAALTVMPDLDQLSGWLQATAAHPRLVMSTVLRDLGVPAEGLPCGSAVASLVAEHGIAAVELRDGTEVWCAVSGDERAGLGWCGAHATARLGRPVTFEVPLRRLTFDRSAP